MLNQQKIQLFSSFSAVSIANILIDYVVVYWLDNYTRLLSDSYLVKEKSKVFVVE